MAAWHYAFFFPAAEHQLDAAAAVASLVKEGYEVSSLARCMVPTDDEGHLGEYGAEVELGEPPAEDLLDRLQNGEQLFSEISKHDASSNIVTTFACSVSTSAANPHLSFGWHKRLFEQLSPDVQNTYWMAIRNAAKVAGAAYVVLAVEASDNFEDRFLEVDGKRILDTECNHQYGHGIWAVWVNRSLGGDYPDGVADAVAINLGDGFVEYSVV